MTTLPTVLLDEKHMINSIAVRVAMVRHRMGKEWGKEWLATTLRRYLRNGDLRIAIKAVEGADAGDEIADAALREVGAELQLPLLQYQELAPGHLQVIAYFQRAGQRAPHKRKRGRAWHDDWVRNLTICFLIELTCRGFGLPPTRNRESRRARRDPSAISIVVAALARNGIHLDEMSVQRHVWFGLAGELARREMAEHPPELFV
jgi:hypothetical protein